MRTARLLRHFTPRLAPRCCAFRSQTALRPIARQHGFNKPFVRHMFVSMSNKFLLPQLNPVSELLWHAVTDIVENHTNGRDEILTLDTSFSEDLNYNLNDMDALLTKIEERFGLSEIPAPRAVQLQSMRDVFEYVGLSIVAYRRTREFEQRIGRTPEPVLGLIGSVKSFLGKQADPNLKDMKYHNVKQEERRRIAEHFQQNYARNVSRQDAADDDSEAVYFTQEEVNEMVDARKIELAFEEDRLKSAGASKSTPPKQAADLLDNHPESHELVSKLGFDSSNAQHWEIQACALSLPDADETTVQQKLLDLGLKSPASFDEILQKRSDVFDEMTLHAKGDAFRDDLEKIQDYENISEEKFDGLLNKHVSADEKVRRDEWIRINDAEIRDLHKLTCQLQLYKLCVAGMIPKNAFDSAWEETKILASTQQDPRAKKLDEKMNKIIPQ